MKVKLLVAPTEIETMPFTDFETVLKNYLQPRKRLVIAHGQKSWQLQKRTKSHQVSLWPKSEKQILWVLKTENRC